MMVYLGENQKLLIKRSALKLLLFNNKILSIVRKEQVGLYTKNSIMVACLL